MFFLEKKHSLLNLSAFEKSIWEMKGDITKWQSSVFFTSNLTPVRERAGKSLPGTKVTQYINLPQKIWF